MISLMAPQLKPGDVVRTPSGREAMVIGPLRAQRVPLRYCDVDASNFSAERLVDLLPNCLTLVRRVGSGS